MALDDRDYMRDRARRGRSSVNRDSWMGMRHQPSRPTRSTSDPKALMWLVLIGAVFALVVIRSIDEDRRSRRVASAGASASNVVIRPGTGPNGRSEPAYVPPPMAPEVPFPQSGSIGWWSGVTPGAALAKITIQDLTRDPRFKVYRLRQASTGARLADVYLAPGSVATIAVPLDVYSVTLAAGDRWEGQERQFGPQGGYWDMGRDAYPVASEPGGRTYTQQLMPFRPVANSRRTDWRGF